MRVPSAALTVALLSLILSSALATDSRLDSMDQFRSIFHHLLNEEKRQFYPNLIYKVPKELTAEAQGDEPAEMLNQLQEVHLQYEVKDLLDFGKKDYQNKHNSPHFSLKQNDFTERENKIISSHKKNPMTIVIIPGVLGEFIEHSPYHQLFVESNLSKSIHAKKWQKALQKAKEKSISQKVLLADPISTKMSSKEVGKRPVDVSDLVVISDLFGITPNDPRAELNGSVQVILLKLLPFSLESLGTQKSRSKLYLERLNKVFEILGKAPENIVFLGYSRGHPVALEMLMQMEKDKTPWKNSVKATISLGGVNYGSELADEVLCDSPEDRNSPVSCQQFFLLEKAANRLKFVGHNESDSFWVRELKTISGFATIAHNNLIWLELLTSLASLDSEGFLPMPPKDLLIRPGAIIEWQGKINKFLNSSFRKSKVNQLSNIKLAYKFAFDTLKMDQFNSNYDANIKRFQIFIQDILDSVKELSTKGRLAWWKNNNLPVKGRHFYSISGVMTHPEVSPRDAQIMNNRAVFNPDTEDHHFLLDGYKKLTFLSGQRLNDSQVHLSKTVLRNEINAAANSYYIDNPMQTTWMGLMGVHHWGFAFPVAFQMIDNSINPFPRITFLQSMATFISLDQTKDQ